MSGPIRDCQHPRANHQHGTALGYNKDGCRCTPCREAHARVSKKQRLDKHRRDLAGIDAMRDPAEARAHLRMMSKRGMYVPGIAEACGISINAARRIMKGYTKHITNDVHERIMRAPLPLAPQHDSARVSVLSTRRRMQALAALGYTYTRLGKLLDIPQQHARVLATGQPRDRTHRNRYITTDTRDRVAALYEQLWNTPPVTVGWREAYDANAARERAAAAGWALPMDLDDDRLDDPEYRPVRTYRRDAA